MQQTPPTTSVEHEAPLFSDLRPKLFAERPQSEALFDVSALRQPRPGPRLARSAPRHAGSGLIDLFALTGATRWNRDEAPGTLVHEVSRNQVSRFSTPPPPPSTPPRRPSRLRKWLLPGVTAVCTTAGLFALVI